MRERGVFRITKRPCRFCAKRCKLSPREHILCGHRGREGAPPGLGAEWGPCGLSHRQRPCQRVTLWPIRVRGSPLEDRGQWGGLALLPKRGTVKAAMAVQDASRSRVRQEPQGQPEADGGRGEDTQLVTVMSLSCGNNLNSPSPSGRVSWYLLRLPECEDPFAAMKRSPTYAHSLSDVPQAEGKPLRDRGTRRLFAALSSVPGTVFGQADSQHSR